MKILILGGTGAMGEHLVRELSELENELWVTSRRTLQDSDKVNYIQGNAQDISFIRDIAFSQKWDAIVDFMIYSTASFKERADLLLNATSQYIFLSSSRVYADSNEKLSETSPRLLDVSTDEVFLRTDEYSLSKARQENILINSGKKNWTIIRPYITYSENRLQLGVLEKESWLYRALNNKTIVFSSDINKKITTLTYGLDVARGIKNLIGQKNALGEVFHITQNHSTTWSRVLKIYLDILENHLGTRPRVLLQDLDKFTQSHPAKYQIAYDRMYNRKFGNDKMAQYISVENFTEVESGLKKCLQIFLENPNFSHIDWRTEALKDRQTKEYTSLRKIHGLKSKIKYLIYRYLLKG